MPICEHSIGHILVFHYYAITILGHWNMQNMPRNYTVVQGKNTDDRVKKKTYLCGQTGHRGCYVIKKLAFLDLKCKMFHSKSHEQNLSINSFFIQVLSCLLLSDQFIYNQTSNEHNLSFSTM